MNKHEKLLTPGRVVDLANRLSRITEIAGFDTAGEPQGETIAHALDGWEDSLHEIGDQLRHILYHIQDTKYFGYLLDDHR